MNRPELSAQLYTVYGFCQDEVGYRESLNKVAKIGYKSVQLSGGAPIKPNLLREMLDQAGLAAIASHESFERIVDDSEAMAAEMRTIGCKYVGVGGLSQEYLKSRDTLDEFIEKMNSKVEFYKNHGICITYHNHAFEFRKLDGKYVMDYLIEGLSHDIQFIIDVYWLQFAGVDQYEFLHRLPGQLELVHFKDMEMVDTFRQDTAEIGEGNINMRRIIEACKEMETRYYIIEQDNSRRDPFVSLEISYRNLNRLVHEAFGG
jgi:sugar phosphate isomerase/epimerase